MPINYATHYIQNLYFNRMGKKSYRLLKIRATISRRQHLKTIYKIISKYNGKNRHAHNLLEYFICLHKIRHLSICKEFIKENFHNSVLYHNGIMTCCIKHFKNGSILFTLR